MQRKRERAECREQRALKGKRLKSEAAEAKRPHIATEQEAKLPCAEKMVDREATLQREDPQRSSSNTEQMLAKLLAGVEVLTSKVQLIEARIGALEEVKQGKPTPAAKSGDGKQLDPPRGEDTEKAGKEEKEVQEGGNQQGQKKVT